MFVLLGSSGQITSRLARELLSAGHAVRIVGRQAGALAPLAEAGAEVAVGDAGDAAFLERAFTGATGVYAMIPPCYAEPDMRAAQDRIGAAIAQALRASRVPRVVNLSSIGAELAEGTGPVAALHAQEERLSGIPGMLHLRPGSFMENWLAATAAVAAAGVLPGAEAGDALIPIVATRDIAAVAARELAAPTRHGVLLLHAARHATPRDVAAAFGAAVGRPGLSYVQSPPQEARAMLLQHGFSASAADQLEQLSRWLSTSPIASATAGPVEVQPTSLEAFAREVFKGAYERAAPAAARAA